MSEILDHLKLMEAYLAAHRVPDYWFWFEVDCVVGEGVILTTNNAQDILDFMELNPGLEPGDYHGYGIDKNKLPKMEIRPPRVEPTELEPFRTWYLWPGKYGL